MSEATTTADVRPDAGDVPTAGTALLTGESPAVESRAGESAAGELAAGESHAEDSLVEESLVEDVSIDGMCGVY